MRQPHARRTCAPQLHGSFRAAVGLGLALAVVAGASADATATSAHKSSAPNVVSAPLAHAWPYRSSRNLFGLSPSAGGNGAGQVVALSKRLHRHVDIVNFYVGWAFPTFPIDALQHLHAIGSVPEITWEPWDYRDGLNQPRFSLQRIIDGKLDWYIKSFAASAAAWRHPLMLRFAQEANGNWYPWSTGVNGNTPGQYATAYRHIHRLFVAAGATNVIWIWSPNAIYRGATSLRSIYPGRRYVDWVAVDGYNAGADLPKRGGWRTPSQVFAPTFKAFAKLAPHKPIMIAETGSAEAGGSKARWIRRLFVMLKRRPQVRALCWFNYDKEADWMIGSSAASQRAMTSSLAATWRRG